jgi:hypothetical protein
MARTTGAAAKAPPTSRGTGGINLPLRKAYECPVSLLRLDLENPRLQTGNDFEISTEEELIEVLADIAALDELVLSICTNSYLNLEPLIVCGQDGGPYTVLEGNRRIAAIRLIQDPLLAAKLGIKIPAPLSRKVLDSIKHVLVYRVPGHADAREFIGFKHINGPQRWDAYAKAKYVTEWYKKAERKITIDEIAAKMGDNNNTLRAYIYAILIFEQAEEAGVWSLKDRPPARGRFGFSHLYTALLRTEYQEFLGLSGGWSNLPPLKPIKKQYLKNLGEVLSYIYGSKSENRQSLIQSQNPDLKNLGLAIDNPRARIALQRGATLEVALDEIKEPASAFHDALVTARLRLDRALGLMSKYAGGVSAIDDLIDEIFAQADTLKTMIDKRRARGKK